MIAKHSTVTFPSAYFSALTGVRAVAALLVFIYHAVPQELIGAKSFLVEWAYRLGQQGYVGVSIFFVLSGFLITARYADSVELTSAWFRRYLQNRFARIYPLYFLLTAFSFTVMLLHPLHTWYELPATATKLDMIAVVLLNLTLTRAFFDNLVFVGLPTAWTLTIEESFYLSAPFLLLLLRRNWRWLCVLPCILLPAGAGLFVVGHRLHVPYGFLEGMISMLVDTFFGRCCEFLVGAGLAYWLINHPRLITVRTSPTTLGAFGILAVMVVLALLERALPSGSDKLLYSRMVVSNFLLPLPIACFFRGLIQEPTWLQRLLQSKLFDRLGKSSYAFYLLHLGTADTLFCLYITSNWAARLVVYGLVSLALYSWVERPLQQRLRASPRPVLA